MLPNIKYTILVSSLIATINCSIHAMHPQPKITKKIEEGSKITYTRPNYGAGCDIASYDPYTMTYKAHRNLLIKGLYFNVSYYEDPRAIYIGIKQKYEEQEQQKKQ